MLKVLEGNIGSVLHAIGVEKEFLNMTPLAQELRPQSISVILKASVQPSKQ